MPALTILIVRHAEKPDKAAPDPGLTLQGTEDKRSLVVEDGSAPEVGLRSLELVWAAMTTRSLVLFTQLTRTRTTIRTAS
jgi:hypothetical protein